MPSAALVFTALGAPANAAPLRLPLVFAHYLPWYVRDPERYALDQGHPAHPAVAVELAPERHWRDPGSGYRWSHRHLPLIGRYDSRDPATIRWQLEQARAGGVHGFTINWYGQNSAENLITLAFLDELERWNQNRARAPFLYFLCVDSQCSLATEGKTPVPMVEDFAYIRRHLMRPGYLLRDGRPVFACFPYEDNVPRWIAALEQVFGSDGADFLWCGTGSGSGETGAYAWVRPGSASLSPGLYPWTDPDDSGAGYLHELYSAWNKSDRGHLYGMAGVWPGFDDALVTWAWKNPATHERARPRLINRETTLGNTYDLTWQAYHAYLQAHTAGEASAALPLPLVQIATWNDYAETTTIEPTHDYGTRLLDQTLAASARARALWPSAAVIAG